MLAKCSVRRWDQTTRRPVTGALADVRVLLSHLPKAYRAKETWRHVAKTLDEAAGGEIQPVEIAIALRLVLSMEGIASRPH
jgi:hypothetical protein